jgi:hypothetical protein
MHPDYTSIFQESAMNSFRFSDFDFIKATRRAPMTERETLRLTGMLDEIRHRRCDYAQPLLVKIPATSAIRRWEFDAVSRAGSDILSDGGRLTAVAIAGKLGWKSIDRVRAVLAALRKSGAVRWTLETEPNRAG